MLPKGFGNIYSKTKIAAALQPWWCGCGRIKKIISTAVAMLDSKYIFDNFLIIPENTSFSVKPSAVRRLMESNGFPLKESNTAILSRQDLNRNATDSTSLLTFR